MFVVIIILAFLGVSLPACSHQMINVHLLSVLHIIVQRQILILIRIPITLLMPPAGVIQVIAAVVDVTKQKNSRPFMRRLFHLWF